MATIPFASSNVKPNRTRYRKMHANAIVFYLTLTTVIPKTTYYVNISIFIRIYYFPFSNFHFPFDMEGVLRIPKKYSNRI